MDLIEVISQQYLDFHAELFPDTKGNGMRAVEKTN